MKRTLFSFLLLGILLSLRAEDVSLTRESTLRTDVISLSRGRTTISLPDSLAKGRKQAYNVLRAEGRWGKYVPIGEMRGTRYTDAAPGNPYAYYYKVTDSDGRTVLSTSLDEALLGPDVLVYGPGDDMGALSAEVNALHERLLHDQFSPRRYAVLLRPGDYRAAGLLRVPYYVELSGLGQVPYSVQVSNIHTPPPLRDDNGTCTFWRSCSNLSVIGPATYEEDETFKWAVSQAAPLRRVYSERVMRAQWGKGWVSGGFAADCYFVAPAGSDHQQQWYYRNSVLRQGRGTFREEKYNYCFQGVELGPEADADSYRDNWAEGGKVTFIPTTPIIREKPFLFVGDDGRYKVFRPALRRDSHGVSYTRSSMGEGTVFDLERDFFVARPGVTARQLNRELRRGRHLLFTPGMYTLDEPLMVTRPGTIVLGLGFATLIPGEQNPETAIYVADVDGVTIASLMFDAHFSSHSLLQVGGNVQGFKGSKGSTVQGVNGSKGSKVQSSKVQGVQEVQGFKGSSPLRHADDPVLLSDLFFRVGGFRAAPVHVDQTVIINSNDVLGDHFWIWRADHGVRGSVGWSVNTADNGLVVNGDFVTLYGLFNEHFQQYQTLWNGEHGRTYFFQCETPYDAPNQAAYMSEEGTRDGYAAYKVAPHVRHHYATAFGIYDVLFTDIRIESSVEVPASPDVRLHHICNNSLSSQPGKGFGFVVNGLVKSTYSTHRDNRTFLVDFPVAAP